MYTAGSVQWVYSHCTAWLQVWRGAASVCLEPGGAQQWSSAAQYWQCPTVAHSVPLYLSRPGPAVQQESSILHPLGQRAVTSELSSCFSLSSQSVKIQDEPTHPDSDRLQQFLCFVTLSEVVLCFGIFVGTQRRFWTIFLRYDNCFVWKSEKVSNSQVHPSGLKEVSRK